MFLQPTQDINVGARIGRGSFQYTLQDPNIAELIEWSQKMLDKMRALPELADASSDLLANAPQLKVSINRDQAARFDISPQLIDDTLNDAYGQRQIAQYFTQLNTYFCHPRNPARVADEPRLARPPLCEIAADRWRCAVVRARRRRQQQGRSALGDAPGAIPVGDVDVQSQVGRGARPGVDAINQAAAELGMPPSVLASFQGDAQAFQASLASMPVPILAAILVVYLILGVLYESYIHPLTILSTLPSAGLGALLALQVGKMDLSVIGIIGIILLIGIVKKNGIILVDFAITATRERAMSAHDAIHQACMLRFRPILMTTAAAMLAGVPLALGTGTGSELRQPLGYAMVGGLALSQLLTLYTTPVVYLYLDRLQQWLRGERGAQPVQSEDVHAVAAE